MGLLQPKPEKTAVISVRVTASLKKQIADLRAEADAAGFDLTITLTEALQRAAKQITSELAEFKVKPRHTNGASPSASG